MESFRCPRCKRPLKLKDDDQPCSICQINMGSGIEDTNDPIADTMDSLVPNSKTWGEWVEGFRTLTAGQLAEDEFFRAFTKRFPKEALAILKKNPDEKEKKRCGRKQKKPSRASSSKLASSKKPRH